MMMSRSHFVFTDKRLLNTEMYVGTLGCLLCDENCVNSFVDRIPKVDRIPEVDKVPVPKVDGVGNLTTALPFSTT